MAKFALKLDFLPSAGMDDGASMGMLGEIIQGIAQSIKYGKDDGNIIDAYTDTKLGTWEFVEE